MLYNIHRWINDVIDDKDTSVGITICIVKIGKLDNCRFIDIDNVIYRWINDIS